MLRFFPLWTVIWGFDILYYFPLLCFAISYQINYLLFKIAIVQSIFVIETSKFFVVFTLILNFVFVEGHILAVVTFFKVTWNRNCSQPTHPLMKWQGFKFHRQYISKLESSLSGLNNLLCCPVLVPQIEGTLLPAVTINWSLLQVWSVASGWAKTKLTKSNLNGKS